MTPDVLYRVRPGQNEKLRYSLRSLSNVHHGDVHIVGYPPKWVTNVNVITPKTWRTKWRALVGDLALACRELQGRRLLLMDDDYYILRDVGRVPVMHNGDLREAAERKVGAYSKTMKTTADYLEGQGSTTLSYELHMPMEMDADAMLEAITPVLNAPRPVQARSVYGNVMAIGGTQVDDVKVERGAMPADYLSTSPQSWRYWLPQLALRFPTPSEYE